jgi:hypothetical protein
MQRSTFAVLGFAIAGIGIGGAVLPGLVDSGDPISYLRGTSHGAHGTTTGADRPEHRTVHRWGNEATPVAASPGQMTVTVPESGGRPRGEQP